MRRLAIAVVLGGSLLACAGPLSGGPAAVSFRAISERQNPALCVRGPAFAMALTREEWRAVWARSTGCQPTPPEPPPLRSDEAGVAAWWRVEPCLGYAIRTRNVTTDGRTITVSAESRAPAAELCASALGGLESFLALDAAAVRAATRIRFVLDGVELETIEAPGGR
jgi:hypothetical protein